MILTKSKSVRFDKLTPAMAYMLYSLSNFHNDYRFAQPENLIITSLNDGVHGKNSRHYKDEAIDIRSKNFNTREDKRLFRQELELVLGNRFRVLLENEGTENEHFHVQVKKGTQFK